MSHRLRLLHIGNGGAFKIRAILDGLLARGHELHMVPIPPAPGGIEGVTWHRLDDSPLPGQAKVLYRFWQIRRLAKRLQPDIVHAHNAWGPGWYGAATGIHPLVIHAYGGDVLPEQYRGRPSLQRRLTSWACRRADRIIVTGQHMIAASQYLGIDPGRISLLPRGVDTKRYRPGIDVTALRASLGLGNAAPVILSPRYQVNEALYNLDIVIEAFVEVKRQLPDAVCLQMYDPGRSAGADQLRSIASRHGLGKSYRLVACVDNATMPLFYNLANVAVSVPSSDGFPVTVLEASACGCPLVVSNLPYCREWFSQRENGLVVGIRDAHSLAEALLEICTNTLLARKMAAEGRLMIEDRADYERCMDALESLYRGLLDSRERPPGQA